MKNNFEYEIHMIEENNEIFNRINGKSYVKNPDISIDELRYIKLNYYDFNNNICYGELIVNESIVEDIVYIFSELFINKYQIHSIKLIDEYEAENQNEADYKSMLDNNTSSFNYRIIKNTNDLSYHAYGLAIDINPLNNPYIININGKLDYDSLTKEELYYAMNRDENIPHVITHNDLVYKLFIERGFEWGGDWNPKYKSLDYQHFEKRNVKKSIN